MDRADTRYAWNGEVGLAYQGLGKGPVDLVYFPTFTSNVEWRELLAEHYERTREQLRRFRGREVDVAGDGLSATFDGPARAARCAQAIVGSVRPLGSEIRAGCHTGEVQVDGAIVRGIAVHIGARVAALAGPGEVLVSSTIKDLTAGFRIVFEDAGEHELKGVPDRLYRVVDT